MATTTTYTGDGVTVLYGITFDYLQRSHVKATINGIPTTNFTFANDTTIQFTTAPPNLSSIVLFRETPSSKIANEIFPASSIPAAALNENFAQSLYVAEETFGAADQVLDLAAAANQNALQAVSLASDASDLASDAADDADAALTTANSALFAVSAVVSSSPVANLTALLALSPVNGQLYEVQDSTGMGASTAIINKPSGYVGDSGIATTVQWVSASSKFQFISYRPLDPDDRYLQGSGTFVGDVIGNVTGNVSGTASSAATLTTPRQINGVAFNGSANITLTAATPQLLTFNNAGTGAASGTTFDGSAARTISHNSIGAPSTTGSGASGTWGISISGNAATATNATSAAIATTATNANALNGSRTINGVVFDNTANINVPTLNSTSGNPGARVVTDTLTWYTDPPVVKSTSGTINLTAAEIAGGLIQYTNSGNATINVPTGSALDTYFNAEYVGMTFTWAVQVTTNATVTLAGATGHTYEGRTTITGGPNVAYIFQTRRTAANTYITYRISTP